MATSKTPLAILCVLISILLVFFAYANIGGGSSFIAAFISIALMLVPSSLYLGYISSKGELASTLLAIIVIVAVGALFTAGAFFAIFIGIIFCSGGLTLPLIIAIGHVAGMAFKSHTSKKASGLTQAQEPRNQLEEYVNLARATKMTDAQITDRLLMNGWQKEEIETVL